MTTLKSIIEDQGHVSITVGYDSVTYTAGNEYDPTDTIVNVKADEAKHRHVTLSVDFDRSLDLIAKVRLKNGITDEACNAEFPTDTLELFANTLLEGIAIAREQNERRRLERIRLEALGGTP